MPCSALQCPAWFLKNLWGPAKFFGSGPWWPPWAPGAMEAQCRLACPSICWRSRGREVEVAGPKIMKDHEGVSENSVPHCTQWFCWSLSLLNGYFIGNINPTFSDKPMKDHETTLLSSFFIFFRSDVVCGVCISPCSADSSCSWAACRQYVSLAVWYLLLVMEYIVVRIVCQLLVGLWPMARILVQSLHAANSKLSSSGWWLQFANTYKYMI